MPASKSTKKRIRQNITRRLRNRSVKAALRTTVKKARATLDAGNAQEAAALLQAVQKKVDKIAGKGVVHPRTAARIKSRLAKRLNKIKAAGAKAG